MAETSDKKRPFYGEYAWAYELVLARPASRQCVHIARLLSERAVIPASRILDAGCGTGSYAVELARFNYKVTALDLSAPLLKEARRQSLNASLPVSLVRGNILSLPFKPQFNAMLCRGVLNDLLDDESRRQVFVSFASVLRPPGVLVLDVRDWDETVRRKTCEPVFETSLETKRGRLNFRSETRLEHMGRRLLVREQHTLNSDGQEKVSTHDFIMRCWTPDELQESLARAGFDDIVLMGDYEGATVGASDRIVCVAALK